MLNHIRYRLIYIIATLLRFFPLPTRTRIIKIGNPDANSPVIVTGNYILTVEILKKDLKGSNAFLLVANSRGINVWCAATGRHFTNHDIISAVKTSGIEKLVTHRTLILPQLSATGIEPYTIKRKIGWESIWGPVYSSDIPIFLENNLVSPKMKTVEFSNLQKVEMAVAWAFIVGTIFSTVASIFSLTVGINLLILSWYISLVMFLSFDLFENWFRNHVQYKVQLRVLYPLIVLFTTLPILLLLNLFFNYLSKDLYWIIPLSFVIILIMSFDMRGSTPVYKSDTHEDVLFSIRLNEEDCVGAGDCVDVCPRNCFEMDEDNSLVMITNGSDCIQCGACIVQCQYDALYFENDNGVILRPETIRKYKLNLLGSRNLNKNENM